MKFIIKLYKNHKNLFVKHTHYTLQKAQTLRAAFPSKLENTINNNSVFETNCAELSRKW